MSSHSKQLLFTAVPFGIIMGIAWAVTTQWPIGLILICASVLAVFFGFTMTAFARSPYIRETTRPLLQPTEHILFEVPANHMKRLEAVGGWLFLTNERLIFKSHPLNLQNHEWSIALQEIIHAQPTHTFGIIPNGLRVDPRSGASERFVVAERREWIERITATRDSRQLPNAAV